MRLNGTRTFGGKLVARCFLGKNCMGTCTCRYLAQTVEACCVCFAGVRMCTKGAGSAAAAKRVFLGSHVT